MRTVYPVILSGGSGSRLWPVSRSKHPKQFLPLHSDKPMLVETALRFNVQGFSAPRVVCNQHHRFMVAQCFADEGIASEAIILEPVGRNTAPAVAVSALHIERTDPDGFMLVLPSDHVIQKEAEFVEKVLKVTQSGVDAFITFGITPAYPETGYGYIQQGEAISAEAGIFKLSAFYEKPDMKTAKSYIQDGSFLWNSGMFLFPVAKLIDELKRVAPDVLESAREALNNAEEDLDFIRLAQETFEKAPNISIDHALMEKTKNACVVPVDIGWDDLGSWAALWDISEKDAHGNAVKGEAVLKDVRNSLVHNEEDMLTAIIGVEDLLVVNNDDVLLIAHKERSQEVKDIVETLKKQGSELVELHSTVNRPWGTYKTIDRGEGYLVKVISVRPGASLSLQYHHYRAEHWVVVKGEATVTRGEETFLLKKNESTYIPRGVNHRLQNFGEETLHMIEVQSGDYLSEDDIVRLDDDYKRV